jgi:hypothetical protein
MESQPQPRQPIPSTETDAALSRSSATEGLNEEAAIFESGDDEALEGLDSSPDEQGED